MATHSSVLAWRIPGTVGPGGLPSMGSHRVGHDWSDLAAAGLYSRSLLVIYCIYIYSSGPDFWTILIFFPKQLFPETAQISLTCDSGSILLAPTPWKSTHPNQLHSQACPFLDNQVSRVSALGWEVKKCGFGCLQDLIAKSTKAQLWRDRKFTGATWSWGQCYCNGLESCSHRYGFLENQWPT